MCVDHFSSHAAIDGDLLARNEARTLGRQKQDGGRNVGRFANPADRMLIPIDRAMLHRFAHLCFGPRAGFYPAGQDCVDADVGPRLIAKAWVRAQSAPLAAA